MSSRNGKSNSRYEDEGKRLSLLFISLFRTVLFYYLSVLIFNFFNKLNLSVRY